MELYEGQLKNYEWNITSKRNHHKGKSNKSKCEDIMCFDTESTSAFIENGQIIGYRAGESDEYWNSLEPVSVCYIWMFAVNDLVFYGREISDFINLLKDLPEAECAIYVHNLSYDFNAALINILNFNDVFARSPHKPMYARCEEFPHITFKCSYTLTNLSLESWGKTLTVQKKSGDLDYLVLRTPKTELTDVEMGYCEFDVKVMVEGLRKYRERFGSIWKIPMTKTGIVRKKVKELLCCPYYVKLIKKLVPKTAEHYHMLMDCFAGGYTHANRWYSGDTIISGIDTDYIGHKDFASSYPTWMICGKFPCTPWVLVSTDLPDPKTFEDTAYIIKLEMWDIQCQTFNTYLQASKCTEVRGAKFDNGRIISAEHVCYTCSELDYDILIRTYKIGKIISKATYSSVKDYLPDDFREYVLQLYADKTRWKNVKGFEDIYMNAKADINSTFGMAVTSIMSAEVVFDNNQWYAIPLTREVVQEKLDDLRKYNPRDHRYFLSYSWGVWIAALARHALWECILRLDTPYGKNDCLYCDTDSIFYINKQDFSWYDDMIDEKLRVACEEGGLDFNLTHPLDPDGVEHPLGHFTDEDETITEFRCLGAKRYCTRLKEDGNLHITVAGINKSASECLNNDIENFKDGMKFDKDHPAVHKLLHTYLTEQPEVTFPDGYILKQQYGVNMRPIGYSLEISDDYIKMLEFLERNAYELEEQMFINIRGKFEV